MANMLLVMGSSGGGKSTSIRTLDPKTTCIFQVVKKDLPFKGWKKMYTLYSTDKGGNLVQPSNWENLCNAMKHISAKCPHIKTFVIDDVQYVMGLEFMARGMEKGYDKFSEIGMHMMEVINTPSKLRSDLTVVFLSHTEEITTNAGLLTKMKTLGKMLDSNITLEGLFAIVLIACGYTGSKDKEMRHVFITQSNGSTTAKSPMGMFEREIPNDLQLVLTKMEQYYEGE